ncbi:hypothetical protein A6R68_12095 [Neotoma lepida]|uniref:Uncharacterized protein n=1 Tax=Neotoma lepida TaxID=56216 RepID=A0A1A6H631_NEOLE|nr:hypothetical protein A6R68_12095 [Neotoma lepida]
MERLKTRVQPLKQKRKNPRSITIELKDESHQVYIQAVRNSTSAKHSLRHPKPRKMDNSKAAEDNPPSQDILATSEAAFPTDLLRPSSSLASAEKFPWLPFLLQSLVGSSYMLL